MSVEELVQRGECLHQELGRESYLTGAGLKDTPEFQRIFDQFADLCSDDALAMVREMGPLELLEWIVDLRTGRRTAGLEEQQILWEQGATVQAGGRDVSYLRAPIEMANSPDRAFRLELDAARVAAGGAALTGIRRDRFAQEREEILALEMGDYVATRATFSGIDLDALGVAVDGFLADTDDMYREVLERVVRRRIGVPLGDLVRADSSWAFRADGFDGAFREDQLIRTAVAQAKEMGIDPLQHGRIRLDTEERPAKQPRAFCAPVRVPDEVYLVLRPRGGHADYQTFWHEHGHALHFASVDPGQSFAARWLGDNSVTEGFAMLFDHMTMSPAWLRRYVDLAQREVRELVFELGVNELFMIRRYAAKLGYELRLHRGDLDRMAPEYVERLTRATLFRYSEGDYLLDVDPGFYSARYLRAWQLQALLGETLKERFDDDWFRNPRAGGFIQNLMSTGQADSADRLASRVSGRGLSFDALRQQLERALDA